MIKYSLIFASTINGGLGFNNDIPWTIKEDLLHFRYLTTNTINSLKKNVIIMGYKTWTSIHSKILKNRINIVLSSKAEELKNENNIDNLFFFNNLDSAINFCNDIINNIERVFIIGGSVLFNYILYDNYYNKYIENIYISLIYKNYLCDRFIDIKYILKNFKITFRDVYFHPEFMYLIAYNKT